MDKIKEILAFILELFRFLIGRKNKHEHDKTTPPLPSGIYPPYPPAGGEPLFESIP